MAKKSEIIEVEAIDVSKIQSLIHEFRGEKIILDRDLAVLYGVETKVLNQAVKRNIERFPKEFMFQLTKNETNMLSWSQIVTLENKRGKNIKYAPYAFTEQGVAMLSAVLKSPTAVAVSIGIMKAFVELRHLLVQQHLQNLTVENLKLQIKQLEEALENNLSAVNDLSEDVRKEIDNIYQAIGELSIRQKELEEKPKPKPMQPVGFC